VLAVRADVHAVHARQAGDLLLPVVLPVHEHLPHLDPPRRWVAVEQR
jgi:hypothetical protein